ncbi:NADH:flavin oxidoreductase [uncultured Robinsoniella sp.]|uniref:NADH:flavin oxidoreductase n=1 Tax=uncultured Robinsoniella sp. TaxID=904190 RepID=UPI00374F7D6F
MKQLFEPLKINSMVCRNRFLRSATWEALSDEQGHLTNKQKKIYTELAKNEVGLICTGYARILEEEQPNEKMMGIYNDSFIPEYQSLTKSVHKYGAKIMMQLAYGGTKSTYRTSSRKIFSPGDIPEKSTGTAGVPMTKEDIRYVTNAYVQAARRVKESGFDAVQIHGGHSYLLNQFLSPYYNNRPDEYGGSLSNRLRIIREIYDGIRQEAGKDFPILIKITCSDFFEGGLTFEEALPICRELEEMGFDAIEVSGNIHGKANSMSGQIFDGYPLTRGGYFIEYAKVIANEVQIPVFVTGGISHYDKALDWLENSRIAGFGFCRALLTEPNLIKRWKDGDMTPARCLHCSQCRTREGNYCTVFHKGKL